MPRRTLLGPARSRRKSVARIANREGEFNAAYQIARGSLVMIVHGRAASGGPAWPAAGWERGTAKHPKLRTEVRWTG
jgi:hypothetical protein